MKAAHLPWAIAGILALACVLIGYLYYQNHTSLSATLSERSEELASTIASLQAEEAENRQLADALEAERDRNDAFQEQIDGITGTVGRLDKLSRTDPELLQKYSKIYFLNENYAPEALTPIAEKYRFQKNKVEEVHTGVAPYLKRLLEAAEDDDIQLLVASSYRSFTRQSSLKSSYTVQYGTGANAFSAEQGYSEHQLGTTVDFTTAEVGGTFVGFDQTDAYAWLTDNAHRYGFILSYPAGNTYYQYEPWHWRFVGVDLARDLARDDKDFYDLDQRELDEYLVEFFD